MQTEKEGFVYRLYDFKSEEHYQTIKFTEKTPDGKFNPGTTNEEVVQMLIDRFYYLQKNNWSAENATVIILLKNVRQLLAKRLSRKIEKVKKYNEQAGTNTDK
ncbi:MAG TPA: hypothetical protein DCY51_09000 [Bacteroidetes bacterium]|jgi:hypothetical protein|nr:hypothetical protein [Bacteroidota bacterium]